MTEKERDLLAVFEDRFRELIRLYDEKKRYIEVLEKSLGEREGIIRQNKQTIEPLQENGTV